MKEFPSHFKPENKGDFSEYRYKRNLAYMRKEIFELVLKGNENDYFDLDIFRKTYCIERSDLKNMLIKIMEELTNLGWNVKTSFGETGLFIFSSEKPPESCHDDEF